MTVPAFWGLGENESYVILNEIIFKIQHPDKILTESQRLNILKTIAEHLQKVETLPPTGDQFVPFCNIGNCKAFFILPHGSYNTNNTPKQIWIRTTKAVVLILWHGPGQCTFTRAIHVNENMEIYGDRKDLIFQIACRAYNDGKGTYRAVKVDYMICTTHVLGSKFAPFACEWSSASSCIIHLNQYSPISISISLSFPADKYDIREEMIRLALELLILETDVSEYPLQNGENISCKLVRDPSNGCQNLVWK